MCGQASALVTWEVLCTSVAIPLQRRTHEGLWPRPTEVTWVGSSLLVAHVEGPIPRLPSQGRTATDWGSSTLSSHHLSFHLKHLSFPCQMHNITPFEVASFPGPTLFRWLVSHALCDQPQLGRQSTEHTANTGDRETLRWPFSLETCSAIRPTHSPTSEHASNFSFHTRSRE
jgi:hypothetical protein